MGEIWLQYTAKETGSGAVYKSAHAKRMATVEIMECMESMEIMSACYWGQRTTEGRLWHYRSFRLKLSDI